MHVQVKNVKNSGKRVHPRILTSAWHDECNVHQGFKCNNRQYCHLKKKYSKKQVKLIGGLLIIKNKGRHDEACKQGDPPLFFDIATSENVSRNGLISEFYLKCSQYYLRSLKLRSYVHMFIFVSSFKDSTMLRLLNFLKQT